MNSGGQPLATGIDSPAPQVQVAVRLSPPGRAASPCGCCDSPTTRPAAATTERGRERQRLSTQAQRQAAMARNAANDTRVHAPAVACSFSCLPRHTTAIHRHVLLGCAGHTPAHLSVEVVAAVAQRAVHLAQPRQQRLRLLLN